MTQRQFDELKTEAPFAAGAFAFAKGRGRAYGCHFGLRSTRDACNAAFQSGYDAAARYARIVACP